MRNLATIRAQTPKTKIFRGQIQHAMLATLLVVGTLGLLHDEGARFCTEDPDLKIIYGT